LKLPELSGGTRAEDVETLRKPSTGLKHLIPMVSTLTGYVETLRKPSTGLKPAVEDDPGTVVVESRHSENPARD